MLPKQCYHWHFSGLQSLFSVVTHKTNNLALNSILIESIRLRKYLLCDDYIIIYPIKFINQKSIYSSIFIKTPSVSLYYQNLFSNINFTDLISCAKLLELPKTSFSIIICLTICRLTFLLQITWNQLHWIGITLNHCKVMFMSNEKLTTFSLPGLSDWLRFQCSELFAFFNIFISQS